MFIKSKKQVANIYPTGWPVFPSTSSQNILPPGLNYANNYYQFPDQQGQPKGGFTNDAAAAKRAWLDYYSAAASGKPYKSKDYPEDIQFSDKFLDNPEGYPTYYDPTWSKPKKFKVPKKKPL